MRKSYFFFLIILCVVVLFAFFPINGLFLGSQFRIFEKKSEDFLSTVILDKIRNPGPLRFFGESFASNLTRDGVFDFTNRERVKAGMGALKLNANLNSAAEFKIDDMFKQQYFAHVSPDGISASELAKNAGYDYIVVGENLALGNFKDDEELVVAWMASPGHRANILTKRYLEIGIAVRSGQFEGKTVWLAVQTFGTPASSCGSLDATLKVKIEDNRVRLAELEASLTAKKAEIDKAKPKTGHDYNIKLEEYNIMVNEYNALVKSTKELVSEYNVDVETYNKCAQSV